jgi:hypothetical protein
VHKANGTYCVTRYEGSLKALKITLEIRVLNNGHSLGKMKNIRPVISVLTLEEK